MLPSLAFNFCRGVVCAKTRHLPCAVYVAFYLPRFCLLVEFMFKLFAQLHKLLRNIKPLYFLPHRQLPFCVHLSIGEAAL
jgi:hypothetical protein